MMLLAQTLTAVPVEPSVLDRLDAVVVILLTILAAYQKFRASKATGLLDVVIAGVDAYKATLPKQEAKKLTGTIASIAIQEGAEPALHKEVKRVTENTIKAYREDGLPKLVTLICATILLGAAGCVSAAAHNAALAAQESGAILRKASVANPAYDEKDREAYERLWGKHEAALNALAEETR